MSKNLEESVVLITSSRSEPKYKDVIGTGFVIHREARITYVLTCAHVVKDMGGEDSVQIYGKSATVIASSDIENFDLAVIQVENENLINFPVLKIKNFAQEGASVKIAGYYLYSTEKKRSLATIQGILEKQISRVDQNTGERMMAWKINISNEDKLQKGYSGSPVVELDTGFVIGVVTNMGTGGQTGEIISVEALEMICPFLLQKLKIQEQLEEQKREKEVKRNPQEKQISQQVSSTTSELSAMENKKAVSSPQKLPHDKIELKSEKGVDYTKLRDLLAAGKWKEADEETANVMLEVAERKSEGWLQVEDIDNFPCEDLRTINRLWLHYSDGKFGFSVQKEIYESLKGTRGYNHEVWKSFGDRVGWRKGEYWLNYDSLTFNLDEAPTAHLPCILRGSLTRRRMKKYFSSFAQRLLNCEI